MIKITHCAPVTTSAPFNDLIFLQDLEKCSKMNANVSEIVSKAMQCHLLYLNEVLAALSSFSNDIDVNDKQKMVLKNNFTMKINMGGAFRSPTLLYCRS